MKFKLAIDMIGAWFEKFLMSVLMMGITLVFVMAMVGTYMGNYTSYIAFDDVLSKGGDRTAIISYLGGDINGAGEFRQKLSEREEIYCIGANNCYGAERKYLPDIYDIQNGHARMLEYNLDGCIEVYSVSRDLLPLTDMKIAEGIQPQEIEFGKNIVYLYLGSAYKDIPIGKEYSVERYKYVVAGRLSDNCQWINENVESGFQLYDLNPGINTEYMVINVEDENYFSDNSIWLSINDGYSMKEVKKTTMDLAKEYDLDISFTTIREKFDEVNNVYNNFLSYFSEMMSVLIPVVIIMLISTQLVIMLSDFRQYGIMYAVGYSKRDISGMLLWRQILIAITSLVAATGITYLIIKYTYYQSGSLDIILKIIVGRYVIPVGFIASVIIVVIVQTVTNITLSKMTPDKLIRSNV